MKYLSHRISSVAALSCFLVTVAASPDSTGVGVELKIEDVETRYEYLQKEYNDKKCAETWAPFPVASADKKPTPLNRDKSCMCGFLHDQAVSQLRLLEAYAGIETEIVSSGHGALEIIHSNVGPSSSSEMTPLEAWALSRTYSTNARCENGFAAGFPCRNVDLLAHLPLNALLATNTGAPPVMGNDLWGWHEGDREFVVYCVNEGNFFLEVTGGLPTILGYLPTRTGGSSPWCDVKIANDFAYMANEVFFDGMQIFDMKRLLTIDPATDCINDRYCQELDADQEYRRAEDTHNLVVNEDSDFVYSVGDPYNGCDGGLHIVDVSDPMDPRFVNCYRDSGIVHDAQCVNYKGPDTRYQNREICFCYNEDNVSIVDVTNKNDIALLSQIFSNTFEYTHQGWLSTDQSHIIFGDEEDEKYGKTGGRIRTFVVEVTDLTVPGELKAFFGERTSVDHNLYVARISSSTMAIDLDSDGTGDGADLIFQANYEAGLGITQVLDYDTADVREIAYFDTFPLNNTFSFDGAWSVFPFFPSGQVAIGTIESGLFLVKPNLEAALIGIDPPTNSPTKRPKNSKKQKNRKNNKKKNMRMRNRTRVQQVRKY